MFRVPVIGVYIFEKAFSPDKYSCSRSRPHAKNRGQEHERRSAYPQRTRPTWHEARPYSIGDT